MLEIFLLFFRIGSIAFGGPIALIAIMEQELCHKRRWFTVDEFTQVFAICKLLPGPVAIQTAIYLIYTRRGRLAGFLAGFGLTLPASIIMLGLSYLYHGYSSTYGSFAIISAFMQNAALAIIIMVTFDLGKTCIQSLTAWVILFCAGIIIFILPTWEPLIIIGFGIFGLIRTFKTQLMHKLPAIAMTNDSMWQTSYGILSNPKLPALFWICFKASAFVFGTGLAIIPLLQGELVGHMHWLSDKQFIDGITLGQVTPGPVSTSVIFFGYITSGFAGAIIAAIGFYLPPLIITLVILPLFWQKIVSSRYLQIFSFWAFPAIIGGLVAAAIKIGMSSISNSYDAIVLVIALIIVYKKLLPAWLLIPAAGAVGAVVAYI